MLFGEIDFSGAPKFIKDGKPAKKKQNKREDGITFTTKGRD